MLAVVAAAALLAFVGASVAVARAATEPSPPRVVVRDGKVTARLEQAPLAAALAAIAQETGAEVRGEVLNPRPVTLELDAVPLEDALERAGRCRTVGVLHLVRGRLPSERDDEIGERPRRDRGPDRNPVELALQVREHEPDRLRRARRGRHEVDRRRPCAPQVLVGRVLQVLVLRVRVDRRHEAGLDLREVVQDLRERRHAVRRAGGVGDDVVGVRIVGVVVDAEHERDVRIGRGRRDEDLLRAGVEVLLGALAVGEDAGRLDHHVDAEVAPGERRGIALAQHLQLLPTRAERAVGELDLARERPQVRVVAEQVGHRLRVAEVVQGDDVDVRPERLLRPEEVSADAPEPVDADANPHPSSVRSIPLSRRV